MPRPELPEPFVARLQELLAEARDERPSPARRREIHRRLGRAAHALGLEAEAARYLQLAGDAAPPEAAAGAPRFALRLLGQPLLCRIDAAGSRQPLGWRLRRAFESVAFLALAPDHRASKHELFDAVWRDVDAESVGRNFHPTLSEARRMLGRRDAFTFRQGIYCLNPELCWEIDYEHFHGRVADGRRLLAGGPRQEPRALEALLAAWKLYRGPLLQGSDADWIRSRRRALQRDYAELLRTVGDLSTRLERWRRAVDAYRALLLEEPFEERVHLALMELYARQGRRDLVRRQFVRMQELLVEELNVEPGEETQERYHQLMR